MLGRVHSYSKTWSAVGFLAALIFFILPACQYESVLDTSVGCVQDSDCGENSCVQGYCVESLVPADRLDRITVTPFVATISVGSTANFTAELLDADGVAMTDRSPTWHSSHTSVATVDENGHVVAVSPGTTLIRASSGRLSASAALTVSAEGVVVGEVRIEPEEATIEERASVQLGAQAYDGDGAALADRIIAWSTGDSTVARVDSTGLVTGISPGTVTITARSEGEEAQSTITVTERGAGSIQLIPQAATLIVNETLEVTAITRTDDGTEIERELTWSSDEEGVATVDAAGLVTAHAPGTANIVASGDTINSVLAVTVVARAITAVDVTPLEITLEVDLTHTLEAVARAGQTVLTGRAVDDWASSDATVAEIDADGEVTAIAPGIAVMTATIGGVEGRAFVRVIPKSVTAVSVTPAATTITEGGHDDLSVVVNAGGDILTDRVVLWTSNNDTVATVSSTGRVHGLAAGTATITAHVEGEEATSEITVNALVPLAVDHIDVTPTAATLDVGDELGLTAVVRAIDGRVLAGETVAWTSSSGAVSVSEAGLVTAVEEG
ncbi:MAG: Ig-like domain-containing protein, partial [Bradymonadaceae bacterium]